MIENKIKLITLLFFTLEYIIEIRPVFGSPCNRDGRIESGKGRTQSKAWSNQRNDRSDEPMDEEPYPINVVRGRAREWTNLEHSKPLKRSDDAVGFPNPPLPNDLGGINMSNPISKYHCPINLLYGNNLTVKNYFLLVPRGNESCNDSIKQIQSVSDENLEVKSMPSKQIVLAAQGVAQTVQVATILVENTTVSDENLEVKSMPSKQIVLAAQGVAQTVQVATILVENTTVSEENIFETSPNPTVEATTLGNTEMNTSVSEITTPTEFNITFDHEVANTTMEVLVELLTVTSTTNETTVETTTVVPTENTTISTPVNQTPLNISDEILRTLDKYCETFNLSDGNTYTINPVTISLNINSLVEDRVKTNLVAMKKHKRTPKEENCVRFNMSSDLNYTIQPVVIPQESVQLATKTKAKLKKQKRNLAKNKRPTKHSKLLRQSQA